MRMYIAILLQYIIRHFFLNYIVERTVYYGSLAFLFYLHWETSGKDNCTAMTIHIGKEIKAELRRQGRGVTWLAQRLNCDRTNVYNIFKREGIDTWLLQRVGAVLNRNFFFLYCQETGNGVENDSTNS